MALGPILAGIGGIVQAGAGIWQGLMNQRSVRDTNALNERLTREGWEREDSAVQRRAADMRAAGINPLLAAGDGASSGNMPTMQAPQMSGMESAISKGVEGYTALLQAKEERERQKIQTEAMKQNLQLTRDQNINLRKERDLIDYKRYEYENKQVIDQRMAQNLVSEIEERYHNLSWYKQAGLPTNAGNTEAVRFAQIWGQIREWARRNPGLVPQHALDMLGGNWDERTYSKEAMDEKEAREKKF